MPQNRTVTFERECFTQAPCTRRLHATSPVHVRRCDRASYGVRLERGIQADTHAKRFLGRKIARAHRSHSLPRALPSPLAHSLARSLQLVHVRGSPMQTPTTIGVGPAAGVPGRFFALETSRLSRPGLAERGVTGCLFLFFPPRPSVSLSPLFLSRMTFLPFPHTRLSILSTVHSSSCTRTRQSTRARFDSSIINYAIILRHFFLFLSSFLPVKLDNFRFSMSSKRFPLLYFFRLYYRATLNLGSYFFFHFDYSQCLSCSKKILRLL